jgi:hypothetical protein
VDLVRPATGKERKRCLSMISMLTGLDKQLDWEEAVFYHFTSSGRRRNLPDGKSDYAVLLIQDNP